MNQDFKDDYTFQLPIFPFPNANSQSSSSAEMERAIKKASKTILVHSITTKPNFKNGIKTKRQKELYNKREYNKWIDDSYLLMGKSSLLKGDLFAANGSFRQIIKEYPKENTYIEAQIWLARKLLLDEEYMEANEILDKLSNDKKFPKKHIAFLNATYADYYIHKKIPEQAIPKLEIAAKKARSKRLRLRYTFILGQLYQSDGQLNKATEKYLKVIKMSPPYEMTFNARVNLAGSFEAGGNADEIRKQLYKLQRDEKNKEYQDQIYYALGNIDFKEGNIEKAIVNYQLSASKSVSNQRQKAKSYLAIADIKYSSHDYLAAQAYYDSAVTNLDETYPDFATISTRAKSLTRLANNLNSVSFEDSVQFIAKMSENERNLFIDQIIAKVKEKEAEEARKQQEEMMQQQLNMNTVNEMQTRGSGAGNQGGIDGNKWYFYSPSAKSYGQTEFQMKWGKRKLEDNWRRLNKKNIGISDNQGDEEESEKDPKKKKVQDNKSREYYIQNIPLTDSALTVSHNKIKRSLYNAGTIYKDELNEYTLSAKEFDEIIRRYPSDPMVASTAYQQFILYKQLNNAIKSEEYKNMLLAKYPESVYAKLLTNPDFAKELQAKEDAIGTLYESAYTEYNNGNYSAVLSKANQGISDYPNHKAKPKFDLLRALAKGKIYSIDTLRSELYRIIKEYPKTEEASAANDIIALMDVQHPEVKEAQEKIIAKEIYKVGTESESQFFVVIINPKQGNYNQLVFNLLNFNLDNYTNSNLSAKAEPVQGNQAIVVRTLKNKDEALNYFDAVLKSNEVFKDVGTPLAIFIISESNFSTFKQDGSESLYMKFFKENYNR